MRIIGLDPGLRNTGWGIIQVNGSSLKHIANGTIHSTAGEDLSYRLLQLHDGISKIIKDFEPDLAAVEETFVNKNPTSTLKLGMARGVIMMTPALHGLSVGEYTPNHVKKSIIGSGHGSKDQIQLMVKTLLGGAQFDSADAADALAVAICHAHNWQTNSRLKQVAL